MRGFHFHISRHHCGGRGRGFGAGRFGKGFLEGDGLGGRAFGLGRKLASTDLQLLILALLADKPSHGYEIIRALDGRSKGFYVPSPGMVYPALTYLEEIGHATVETDGARKRYHITEEGSRYLAEHRATADALFAQFGRVGERVERVRRAMRGAEGAEDEERGSAELRRARRALKTALAAKLDAAPEEQRRIIDILLRAAKDIGS